MPNAVTAMPSSHVRFSQHTLPNGLRVIIAPDRVAPVVAVNLWYDVALRALHVPG